MSRPPTFGLLGDSNFHGQGDDQAPPATSDLTGLARRALNNQYPYLHLAEGGMGIVQITTKATHPVRRLFGGIDHLIIGMVTNDLGTSETGAQIAADINTVAGWAKQAGVKTAIACTCPPNASSTDNWATTTNQTPLAAPQESKRTTLNTLYRTLSNMNAGQALANIDWIADCAAVVEANSSNVLTLNGGYWFVTTNGRTPPSMGTDPHYTSAGHAAAGAVIADAVAHILAGDRKGISS